MAVLSPGIDPACRLVRNFSSRGIDIIGELELGWRFCEKIPVIAVTGTNGKTTTTELLVQTLNACGQRTIACGNIGKPLSEVVREKQSFDVLTVEVSSFQLETIRTFHPSVSLWLNFAPDHLDRYRSVAEYRAAKLRIFENQTNADVAVVNTIEKIPDIRPRTITFSAYANGGDFRVSEGAILYHDESVLRLGDTRLRGLHNIENLMATLAVGMARGLSFGQMVPPLSAYEPQPHRCEFVREINGVAYVNDSKATNLDAVDKALRAQTKPVVLIAGGKDKGFSFDPLRSLVKEKVRSTILIGEMAESVSRSWAGTVKSEIATSLADAVAVSGIIAFNAIKTRENSFVPASSANAEPKPSATASAGTHTDGVKPQTTVTQQERAPQEDPKPSHSPSKFSSKDDHSNAPSVAKAVAAKPVSSGKIYVVKKGDNPVTIAKKLKVP